MPLKGLQITIFLLITLFFLGSAIMSNAEKVPSQIIFYDKNNIELFRLYDNDQAKSKINPIPYPLIATTLSSEDERYFISASLDYIALLRVIKDYFFNGSVSGASTISQQTSRTLLGINRSRTPINKLEDIFTASFLESNYTKEAILQKYLNQAEYGNQLIGIENAIEHYFSTSIENIDWQKSSFLTALLQNPTYLNPYNNLSRLQIRQQRILNKLLHQGIISAEDKDIFPSLPVATSGATAIKAPHFVYFVLEQLEKEYGQKFWHGHTVAVHTTLDYNLYEYIRQQTLKELAGLEEKNIHNNASLVIDNVSGEIMSYIGNNNFFDQIHNGAVDLIQAKRQPGSALKPFIYLAAILNGWGTGTVIYDTPSRFLTSNNTPYTPLNYDLEFHGPVTVRQALANSYNIPAVKALASVGIAKTRKLLTQFGITTLDQPDEYYGLSLALGSGEVSLFELTNAYRTLANQGRFSSLQFLQELVIDNQIIAQTKPETKKPDTALASTTTMITHILSDQKAREPEFQAYNNLAFPFPVAAKTGTSRDFNDNWTMGYSSHYTVGVWTGNADGSPMKQVNGITGAGPIFQQIMQHLPPGKPLVLAQEVEKTPICLPSGQLPTNSCRNIVQEFFLPGTAPKKYDTWYQSDGSLQLPIELKSFAVVDQVAPNIAIIKPEDLDIFHLDPEIPDQNEIIPCQIAATSLNNITIKLNGNIISHSTHCNLPKATGNYTLTVSGHKTDGSAITQTISYQVITAP